MHKTKMAKTMVFLLLMVGILFGCSKTETPTSSTNAITTSKIAVCYVVKYFDFFYSGARLVSDPVADISTSNTTLTWGDSLNSITYQKMQIQGGIEFEFDTTHNFLDTTLTLKVISDVGNCQGSIQIPESTYLYTPSFGAILPIDSVICTWAKAARADWYWVQYEAYAFDSLDNYLGYLENEITVATDTTISLPNTFFDYTGADYYHVYLYIYPLHGPEVQAGAIGNMTGTIKGFLNSEGQMGYTYFYVGSPLKGVKTSMIEHKTPSPKERIDKYLQMITGQ